MNDKNCIPFLWIFVSLTLVAFSANAMDQVPKKKKLPSKISVIEINKELLHINALIDWYFAYQNLIHDKNPQDTQVAAAKKFLQEQLKSDQMALNIENELKGKLSNHQRTYLDQFLQTPFLAKINLREHQFFDSAQQLKILEILLANPKFNLNPERQQLLRILDMQSEISHQLLQLLNTIAKAFVSTWVIKEKDEEGQKNWKKKLQKAYQNEQHLLYEPFSNAELGNLIKARNHPAFFLYLQTIFQKLIAATAEKIPPPPSETVQEALPETTPAVTTD